MREKKSQWQVVVYEEDGISLMNISNMFFFLGTRFIVVNTTIDSQVAQAA